MMLFIKDLGQSDVKTSLVFNSLIWVNPSLYKTIPVPLNFDFACTVADISNVGAMQYAADIGGWCDTYSERNMKSQVTSSYVSPRIGLNGLSFLFMLEAYYATLKAVT